MEPETGSWSIVIFWESLSPADPHSASSSGTSSLGEGAEERRHLQPDSATEINFIS